MANFVDEEGPIIGIDLGTTFSCVAVYDNAAQKVVVLPNSIGELTTPSWVAYTQTGRVVGQPAKAQASLNAANTIYDVKRFIGRSLEDPVTREEARRFLTPSSMVEMDALLSRSSGEGRRRDFLPRRSLQLFFLR